MPPTARLIGLGNLIDKTDENEKAKKLLSLYDSNLHKELHEVIDDMGRVFIKFKKPGSKIRLKMFSLS